MSAIISARPALMFVSSLATIISLRNLKSVYPRILPFFAFGYTIPTFIFSNSMTLSPLSMISLKIAADLFNVRFVTTTLVNNDPFFVSPFKYASTAAHLNDPPSL